MHKLVMMMMLTPAEVVIERAGLIQSSSLPGHQTQQQASFMGKLRKSAGADMMPAASWTGTHS